MTVEQKAFYDVLSEATNQEKSNVSIGVVENSENVLVGDFEREEMDIGDIGKYKITEAAETQFSKIGHEIKEQVEKQRNGLGYIESHRVAMKSEANISNMEFRYDSSGIVLNVTKSTMEVAIRFGSKDGSWITSIINIGMQNNVIKVKQKKGDVTTK